MGVYRDQLYRLMERIHPNAVMNMEYNDFCRDFFFCPGGDTKRLRYPGLKFFEVHFDCHEVSWPEKKKPEELSSKHLTWLAKHCKSVYYIGSDKIVLFDSEEALLFQLLDADIDDVAKSGGM